jgi:hypothetical protein
MQLSLIILAIFAGPSFFELSFGSIDLTSGAAAAKDVNGLKLKVDHARLGKRQTTDVSVIFDAIINVLNPQFQTACDSACSSYETHVTQCSALISTGGYSSCICSTPVVQATTQCVNCGVTYSASQADINTIENLVNSKPSYP